MTERLRIYLEEEFNLSNLLSASSNFLKNHSRCIDIHFLSRVVPELKQNALDPSILLPASDVRENSVLADFKEV